MFECCLCQMNWWPIRAVVFKWNICLQTFLCLYPRKVVLIIKINMSFAHEQVIVNRIRWVLGAILCILPPPRLPIGCIIDHMWTQSYVSFRLVTSVWKDIKTFSPHSSLCLVLKFFYLAFQSLTFTIYWAEKFLCSQFGESTLAKPVLYTSYVILFITIKLRPAMGVSQSHFHLCGFCVLIAH